MTVAWYEWENIRNRLVVFGRAIQGSSPYRVVIEPDSSRCPSGYCNFTKKEIAVNPRVFAGTPAEEYQLTKALLVHEAGHRRFTRPEKMPKLIHEVANILEDERVERLMCEEFAGVRWLVRKLSERFYVESEPVDRSSSSPGEVVAYFLQLRWANRIGRAVKGGLSPENEILWMKIRPLVYEAWCASSSEIVHRNAKKIVDALGIHDYDLPASVRTLLDKIGAIEGARAEGDRAETAGGGRTGAYPVGEEDLRGPEPFDGEVLPNDRREGSGREAIEPKPYIQLEERVRPLVRELIEELSWEKSPSAPEPVERGGRLSIREYIRHPSRPFLVREDESKAPPTIALKVIVDNSTSLNWKSGGKSRMESIAEAVMVLHLVCVELGIEHEIRATPQDIRIADLDSGERGKALIAGLVPALCGHEDMGRAIEKHALPMLACPEEIKLVLCLTDGACNDAEMGKIVCQRLRGKVEVIGVLLDPDDTCRRYVSDMFGEDRVICCRSEELPQKLGNILRAVRGA